VPNLLVSRLPVPPASPTVFDDSSAPMLAKLTNHKELKKIIREAQDKGWRFEKRGGHIIGKHVDGVRTTTMSVSPSDVRALKNVKKYLGL
jgi:predicted RNA binding protein YcfA (HicA-like mRNA interferase family)